MVFEKETVITRETLAIRLTRSVYAWHVHTREHKNNAIALLPRRRLFNYNSSSSDYCQMHLVSLVARMRFETRGTCKFDSAERLSLISLVPDGCRAIHANDVLAGYELPVNEATRQRFIALRDHTILYVRNYASNYSAFNLRLGGSYRLANYTLLYLRGPRVLDSKRIAAVCDDVASALAFLLSYLLIFFPFPFFSYYSTASPSGSSETLTIRLVEDCSVPCYI